MELKKNVVVGYFKKTFSLFYWKKNVFMDELHLQQ